MSTARQRTRIENQLTECFGTTDLEALLRPLELLVQNAEILATLPPGAREEICIVLQKLAGLSQFCSEVEKTYVQHEAHLDRAVRTALSSSQELDAANLNMNTIINSLGQGFVLIDLEGHRLPFSSIACEQLLESRPSGRHIRDVLRVRPEATDEFNSWLRLLLTEAIDFEDLSALAPTQFEHSRGRHIQLEFRPVRFANGSLRSVLLIATDRTEAAVEKQTVIEKERYVDRIIQMAKHRNDVFRFLEYMAKSAETLSLRPVAPPPDPSAPRENSHQTPAERLEQVRRILHTIKGGARTFVLDELANDLHLAESRLTRPKAHYDEQAQLILRHLDEIRREFAFLLGDPRNLGQTRIIYRNQIEKFVRRIGRLPQARLIHEIFFQTTLAVPITTLVQHYVGMVSDLADKLNKHVATLDITADGDIAILPEPYAGVFANLIHVFTNMVDHGIETPELRLRRGKPAEGKIRIHFSVRHSAQGSGHDYESGSGHNSRRSPGRRPAGSPGSRPGRRPDQHAETETAVNSGPPPVLIIQVSDDGAGIDPEQVRDACLKNKLPLDKSCTDLQAIQMIFEHGISARSVVSPYSGRGIGMNALLGAVRDICGEVKVESSLGKFTQVTLELPLIWKFSQTKSDERALQLIAG